MRSHRRNTGNGRGAASADSSIRRCQPVGRPDPTPALPKRVALSALPAEALLPASWVRELLAEADEQRSPPSPVVGEGPEADCYTADELAQLLKATRGRIYELASRGLVPCLRLGRSVRFPKAAVAAMIAAQTH